MIQTNYAYEKCSVSELRSAFSVLELLPKKRVYADLATSIHLDFYSKFSLETRPLEFVDCSKIKDSYVITNTTRGWIEYKPLRKSLPDCVFNPPENWKRIKKIVDNDCNRYPWNKLDAVIYYVRW